MRRQSVHLVAVGSVVAACTVALIAIFGHLLGDVSLWSLRANWLMTGGEGAPRLVDAAYTWIASGSVSIPVGFVLDPLAAVMVLVVTFVGALIHIYSCGYMAGDKDYARYFGYLNLFTGAMLILVLADNLPLLFVGWEGVGLCSYLLIGFWYGKDENATAGKKAFIVNRIGDAGFLLGMLLLWAAAGTLTFSELTNPDIQAALIHKTWQLFPQAQDFTSPGKVSFLIELRPVELICVFLFVGAVGKSAQIPLYVWLPDAMAGPTPVSALIHAATMVTAGVYMVARMNMLYSLAPNILIFVAFIGAATAIFAAFIAFSQNDIKKVLAYSTVSQLGFMFAALGTGSYAAAIFHLAAHAFFKACLFMDAGVVIHALGGEQDIRAMGGLRRKLPVAHWTFLVSCLAIAGIPLFAGFFSKDMILLGTLANTFEKQAGTTMLTAGAMRTVGWILYLMLTTASMMTAFYMFRLYGLTFLGEPRTDSRVLAELHRPSSSMRWPLVVLALGATLVGVLGAPTLFAGSDGAGWLFLAGALVTAAVLVWMAFFWASDIEEEAGRDSSYVQWGLIKGPLLGAAAVMVFVGIWAAAGKSFIKIWPAAGKSFIKIWPANWLGEWLKPSLSSWPIVQVKPEFASKANPFVASHGAEAWTMALAVLLSLASIAAALWLYRKGPNQTLANLVATLRPVYKASLNKGWIDELYHLIIVRPVNFSAWLLRVAVDEFLIDKCLVTGAAWAVSVFGWISVQLQTGRVRQYIAAALVGLAVLIFLTTRSISTFDVQVSGSQVLVTAGVKGDQVLGVPEGRYRTKVGYDFNGDGKVDTWTLRPSQVVTWTYDKPGQHRIRMVVQDPRFGKKTSTEKVVTVGAGR
jgi:NADH-quinone oxidoreductase subunit L